MPPEEVRPMRSFLYNVLPMVVAGIVVALLTHLMGL